MKKIIAIIVMVCTTGGLFAQAPNLYMNQSLYTTTTIPLYPSNPGYMIQSLYKPSAFTGGPLSCGKITKFYIKPQYAGAQTIPDFKVRMGYSSSNTIDGNNGNGNLVTPMTLVYSSSSWSSTYGGGTWLEIVLQTPFDYNPNLNIVVTMERGNSGSVTSSNGIQLACASTFATYDCRYNYPGSGVSATQGIGYTVLPFVGFYVEPLTPASPVAGYFSPSAICKSSPVTFLNSFNVSCADTVKWTITPGTHSYTNGTSSSSKSPTVIFTDTGYFTVKLAINNIKGRDSVTKLIHVDSANTAPQVDFIANRTVVARAADVVSFSDLSNKCPSSWSWSSPNYSGNPFSNTSAQNPTATFNQVGTFDICLAASNAVGTNNTCKTNYIKVLQRYSTCVTADSLSRQTEAFLYDEGGPAGSYSPNAANCKGVVIDPCAATVTLQFTQIKLAPGGDSIFVHNGPSVSSPIIFRIGSSGNGTTPSVTATSGKMFVRMLSDGSQEDSGFVAKWSSTPGTYGKPTAAITVPAMKGFGADTFLTDYPILVGNATTGVDVTYAWDFNADGVNDATLKTPYTTFTGISTPTQKVIRLVAINCKGTDTTYKTVVIVPSPNKPTGVDFIADKVTLAPGDTVYLKDLSLHATAWEWTLTPNNVMIYILGTNKNSQNPVLVSGASGCVTVQLKASNSLGSDLQVKTCYLSGKVYCVPGSFSSTSSDMGISNVSFKQINNNSGAGSLVYQSYVDSSYGAATLYKGDTGRITVKRPTNIDRITWKVWIDFNQNGNFYDAGELVGKDSASLNLSSTFNITVPTSIQVGQTVMRVGTSFGSTALDPCATNLGEFEDYRINFLKDDQKPVITLLGTDTINIERNATYVDANATATDNREGNITNKMTFATDLDMTKVGFYTYCYDVSDLYGNKADTKCRVINVKVDLTPPSITLLGRTPDTIHVHSNYNDLGAVAFDNYSGLITNFIVKESTLNKDSVGVFTIKYTVADYFGYSASKIRTVVVIDTVSPVIIPKKGLTFLHSVHEPLNDQLLVGMSDNFYTNIVPVRTGSIDIHRIGNYTVNYSAVDGSGNPALGVSITVQVRDTTAPAISLNGPDTVVLEVFTVYTEPTATVTDNYDLNITMSRNPGGFNKNILGVYNISYTSVDSSGNMSVKNRVIRVVDTKAPVISLKVSDVINWSLGKPWVDPGLQIVDNFYSEALLQDTPYTQITGSVDIYKVGFNTLKYRVTDPSGNISNMVTRTVRILVTGIDDVTSASAVKLYPVPSNGLVNAVVDPSLISDGQTKVTVYNMLGQMVNVLVTEVSKGHYSLNFEQATAGTYYVKISGDNLNYSQKISIVK